MSTKPRVVGLFALLFALSGCASSSSGAAGEVYRWLPGVYQVEGEIRYRSDSTERERLERVRVLGEVTVGEDGPTSFDTLLGVCLEPEPSQDRPARRRSGWDVNCGETAFTLWPDHDRVRGTVAMTVTELRRFGECVHYATDAEGRRSCIRYAYSLEPNRVTRRANVRTTLTR